jgi:hypothetical protein
MESRVMRHTWLIALTIVQIGCDKERGATSRASITVRLPPARPHTPAPGFSQAIDANEQLVEGSDQT